MSLATFPDPSSDSSADPSPDPTLEPSSGQPSAAAGRGRRWPLTRAQAFCLHLTLSLLAFSTLVYAMLAWWFPGDLFALDGGWQGLKLVAMVDLVLGPALTLLLYRPGKPGLALDMALIATVQVAALGYGFVATHQQRTVAVVFADGAFNTLSAQAHAEAEAQLRELGAEPRSLEALARASATGAGVPLLLNPAPGAGEFGTYLEELFNGWPEPHERSDRYVAIGPAPVPTADAATGPEIGPEIGAALPDTDEAAAARALADAALGLDELEDPATAAAVEDALDAAGLAPELVQLHRFKARYASGVAIYDPRSARILEWVRRP